MLFSFLFVFILWLLPHRFENGSIVPTIIFQHPFMFHAFVISIIFSFTGAFSLLLLGNKPKIATIRRCYFVVSILCMASALSILACALFLESCRLVSHQKKENFFFFSSYLTQESQVDYNEKTN
ncbi:hypothetical protein Patl1_26736 [Pistacia atlantica]|uniref:Uncharacterized protein n=1 Tax=Pistacia atlantica TaxID=434234 RepID=A0ACC1B0V9_9ROSI|nr:hypothetical protein Patl1_26736 [Pistacia atlantica]